MRIMCDRLYGIGGTAIMEMRSHPEVSYEMVYHSALGVVSGVCGGGCHVSLAHAYTHLPHTYGKQVSFMAADGIHKSTYNAIQQNSTVGCQCYHRR